MKTSELTGAALNWAVAICESRAPSHYKGVIRATAHPDCPDSAPMFGPELDYVTDWAQAGPIIEREKLSIGYTTDGGATWLAALLNDPFYIAGPTPLIAAMRCFVASKLGDDVEIPQAT